MGTKIDGSGRNLYTAYLRLASTRGQSYGTDPETVESDANLICLVSELN